jgi:hypothetical protein
MPFDGRTAALTIPNTLAAAHPERHRANRFSCSRRTPVQARISDMQPPYNQLEQCSRKRHQKIWPFRTRLGLRVQLSLTCTESELDES